ncbi:exodeoxyribonuclease III [Vagococcus fluvialis]|uniref:Exodeoxyribonuclease III n=1 Tax=Vagococcus fluvialis TaxID=2738 RepID=A0A369B037_9ENTE|nr:exodeoxyribonuclease III [Vagococcus fluvialis]RCX15050.1 exodeoxyribonuclease-3 [Vagococcus fluvialis]RSU05663.1 exodeoxyribonuclease III [Vagococcus fluvialis]UDM71493.1 exodeoxyribonuclease III [Vagococcus fluvialis]UDM76354.1 exodeoxyribonuclease III [Vagococcus fluvialis]UDM83185.1 exodeoxyribonuclease III [Vagococcus fluvialis]
MKLISWNVNGLRAVVKKGFEDIFAEIDADVFCLQETKLQEGQIDLELEGYHQYWNYAVKKGYSGTAIFSKKEALSVKYGIGIEEHDQEGRVITVEYEDFYLVNCYTPNAQAELKRIEYRLKWEEDFLMFLKELEKTKPVILCGDLNVAHNNIDLKNWKTNRKNPGFSDQERTAFTNFLANGFVDSFRHFYPDLEGAYSWWSYRFNARQNNSGWRIDYFCVSEALVPKMEDSFILSDVFGSDHCPVGLTLTVK